VTDILIRRVDVWLQHVYTCRRCGVRQAGGVAHLENFARNCTAESLADQIDRMRLSNQRMPVGWASHGGLRGDEYQCTACNQKEDGRTGDVGSGPF
jgi:hypothetical protein